MLALRGADGVNVAASPVTVTIPGSTPPAVAFTLKLDASIVELAIGSVKVTDSEEFSDTPVAALGGDVSDTNGGVISNAEPDCVLCAGLNAGGLSPPPPLPHPNRLRLASKDATTTPINLGEPTFLLFVMREALRADFEPYCNSYAIVQKFKETVNYDVEMAFTAANGRHEVLQFGIRH